MKEFFLLLPKECELDCHFNSGDLLSDSDFDYTTMQNTGRPRPNLGGQKQHDQILLWGHE
jgi:hypothetical protein